MIEVLRNVMKRTHYPLEAMLVCVRWYAACSLSLRQIEEMVAERALSLRALRSGWRDHQGSDSF